VTCNTDLQHGRSATRVGCSHPRQGSGRLRLRQGSAPQPHTGDCDTRRGLRFPADDWGPTHQFCGRTQSSSVRSRSVHPAPHTAESVM